MKKMIRSMLAVIMMVALGQAVIAQTRYLDEIFDDSEIVVVPGLTYATNIDFLTSDLTASGQLVTDLGTLSALADAGSPYPAEYYDPGDVSTQVKVVDLAMDIYHPDNTIDTETSRPVMIYLHTGNFLPPPLNGSMMGQKSDNLAVDLCRSWAKRGYVAVSIDYRLGWNPVATDVQTRRGTLLNAVYRAIQDTKMAVRYLRADALGANEYGMDESKITLFGEGSGGYMSQAYVTLDKPGTELFLEKFLPNPFDPNTSYVDTLAVGLPSGFGFPNSVNLYRDNGLSAEVHMSINAGGALADESWLEAGDVPMIAFHAVRDDFAPFTAGTVIVPTTQEEVVDVHGSNFFIQKANDLGNNDAFVDIPDGDPYTDRARSLYDQTFTASNSGMETVNASPEGLFSVVQPLQSFLTNISAPWQWWDPTAPLSMVDLGGGVTTHMAQLQSNPNMSEMQSMAFQDTINGFMLPRLMCVYDLPGNPCNTVMNDPCPAPSAILCDNFDDYSLGLLENQAAHWQVWAAGGLMSNVSDLQSFSNSQSLRVGVGPDEDNVLDLGNQSTGVFTAEWMMYVPADSSAYYNSQATVPIGGGDWVFHAFFDTDGTVAITLEDGATIVSSGTYPQDTWFSVEHLIDLNNDVMTLIIDGTVITDSFNYNEDLGGINFYANGATNSYYIDDVIIDGNPDVSVYEYENTAFSIYPNPTEGLMTITSEHEIASAVVRNILGEAVLSIPTGVNTGLTFDMSALKAGIYFVTLQVEGKLYTERVVKQ